LAFVVRAAWTAGALITEGRPWIEVAD